MGLGMEGPYTVRRSNPPVPGGATLKYVVELLEIKEPMVEDENPMLYTSPALVDGGDKEGKAPKNIFALIDTDKDGRLSHDEMRFWFFHKHVDSNHEKIKMMSLPAHIWDKEDSDMDGFVSWDEFTGPKGDKPAKKAKTDTAEHSDEL
jgi:hypothetical protein